MAKFFLSPISNILVAIFLLSAFFIAGQNIAQTFAVADMTALNILKPQQMDYLWKFNTHQAALNKHKIHFYKDYYGHLLKVFPSLWDAYGVLGYCYHYLDDDTKAIESLKMAIQKDPDYFWNYYDLAAIDINESRYQEASSLLQKALRVDPMTSLKRTFTSQWVYLPLLPPDVKGDFAITASHLQKTLQTCFLLTRLLNQAQDNKAVQGALKKIDLELYAF